MKNHATAKRVALDGNYAMAEGVRLARPRFVSAYPITPQTPIVERVGEFIAKGQLDGKYVAVESEHSALTAVVGAAAVGVRTFTATAGAGLALMHEIVGVAAGNRLPIVMGIANRALPSPWSLQTDHSDSMAERDMGWIQYYAENCQEALDMTLIAYRVAETAMLPVMVCIDGFFVSHAAEGVDVPTQKAADKFLPPYKRPETRLDVNKPRTVNLLTSANIFTELKYQQKIALEESLAVFEKACAEYGGIFGRSYGPVLAEGCEGADVALVTLGSCSGTARQVARELRAQGQKVGALRVTSFRPFPKQAVDKALSGVKTVAVIDRSWGLGSEGTLSLEVKSALYGNGTRPKVYDFVAGLGGRDLHAGTIRDVINAAAEMAARNEIRHSPLWVDLQGEK